MLSEKFLKPPSYTDKNSNIFSVNVLNTRQFDLQDVTSANREFLSTVSNSNNRVGNFVCESSKQNKFLTDIYQLGFMSHQKTHLPLRAFNIPDEIRVQFSNKSQFTLADKNVIGSFLYRLENEPATDNPTVQLILDDFETFMPELYGISPNYEDENIIEESNAEESLEDSDNDVDTDSDVDESEQQINQDIDQITLLAQEEDINLIDANEKNIDHEDEDINSANDPDGNVNNNLEEEVVSADFDDDINNDEEEDPLDESEDENLESNKDDDDLLEDEFDEDSDERTEDDLELCTKDDHEVERRARDNDQDLEFNANNDLNENNSSGADECDLNTEPEMSVARLSAVLDKWGLFSEMRNRFNNIESSVNIEADINDEHRVVANISRHTNASQLDTQLRDGLMEDNSVMQMRKWR